MAQVQRKEAIKNTNDQIKKQIEDKEKIKDMEKQITAIERDQFGRALSQNQLIEQALNGERKAKQVMYRELLNTQIQYQKDLKGYGNMTELEKKMNRVDLAAYKNYDNKMYSLVPGINSEIKQDQLSVASKYPKKSQQVDPTGGAAWTQQDEQYRRL